jgi:hypothetical protein
VTLNEPSHIALGAERFKCDERSEGDDWRPVAVI